MIYPARIPQPLGPAASKTTSPLEEATDIKGLVDNMLNAPLQKVTVGQMLGASYPACQELSSRISAKKVLFEDAREKDADAVHYLSGPPALLEYTCDSCGERLSQQQAVT
jgi:hypothetical protein